MDRFEEYQDCVKKFNQSNNEFRFLTDSLIEKSPKKCLFWTIEVMGEKLKSLEQNELSIRTINELEKLKIDYTAIKAEIFDELSFKNWMDKGNGEKERLIHLPLSRLCWASLSFVCKENNIEFKSNYRKGNDAPKEVFHNLSNHIGWECSRALSILFRNGLNNVDRDRIISTYSMVMSSL